MVGQIHLRHRGDCSWLSYHDDARCLAIGTTTSKYECKHNRPANGPAHQDAKGYGARQWALYDEFGLRCSVWSCRRPDTQSPRELTTITVQPAPRSSSSGPSMLSTNITSDPAAPVTPLYDACRTTHRGSATRGGVTTASRIRRPVTSTDWSASRQRAFTRAAIAAGNGHPLPDTVQWPNRHRYDVSSFDRVPPSELT